jgi:O-antigen ligase
MPLAAYLASRARSRAGQLLWAAAGLTVLVGAFATVSRTIVLMTVVMVAVALIVRRTAVVRAWPALLVLVVAVHFAAPGAIRGIYHAFKPRGGLVHSQTARAGSTGSGRVADIAPGLRSWKQAPLLGHGLGTGKTRRSSDVGAITDPKTGAAIIFDDQYLNSLVSIGFLGLVGVLWFVWGAVARLVGIARRLGGPGSDLVAACAVSCAGFGASMLTFDAFSFVQCTLIFFLIAAIGLRARALLE